MPIQANSPLASTRTYPLNPHQPKSFDLTPYVNTYLSYYVDPNENISTTDRMIIAPLLAVPAVVLAAAAPIGAFLSQISCGGSRPVFEEGDCEETVTCLRTEGVEGDAGMRPIRPKSGCNFSGIYGNEVGIWENVADPGAVCAGRHRHSTVWTGAWMIVWGGSTSEGPTNTGCAYSFVTGMWVPLPEVPLEARNGHCAVWTGSEMFVWGGLDDSGGSVDVYYGDGAKFIPGVDGNPRDGGWTPVTEAGSPSERTGHICAWDGDDAVVVWGGVRSGEPLATGARYFPASDSWSGIQSTEAPLGGSVCAANTGTELLAWGWNDVNGPNEEPRGYSFSFSGDGSWQRFCDSPPCSTSPALPSQPRSGASCSWSGSEMMIWGGVSTTSSDEHFNTGSRYNLVTTSWTAMTTVNAPSARREHQSVWVDCRPCLETGALVVWGGDRAGEDPLFGGGVYQPSLDRWLSTATRGDAWPREAGFSMISTSNSVVIWGGYGQSAGVLATGGIYRPCYSDITIE